MFPAADPHAPAVEFTASVETVFLKTAFHNFPRAFLKPCGPLGCWGGLGGGCEERIEHLRFLNTILQHQASYIENTKHRGPHKGWELPTNGIKP